MDSREGARMGRKGAAHVVIHVPWPVQGGNQLNVPENDSNVMCSWAQFGLSEM